MVFLGQLDALLLSYGGLVLSKAIQLLKVQM